MRIQNNIMAMNTHRFYTANNNAVSKSAEKLSSGYRVNRAGDDAAGLAISEKMRAEIRGLSMASKNSQDGVSMVQTAEGALTEVHSMLQRMKELAVQAASDSNADQIDRPALDQEFQQLIKEIDDVAMTTTFNDMNLLDGSFQDKVIQIGSRTGNEMEISIGNMDAYSLGLQNAGAAPVGGGVTIGAISNADAADTATTFDITAAAFTAPKDGSTGTATYKIGGNEYKIEVTAEMADGTDDAKEANTALSKAIGGSMTVDGVEFKVELATDGSKLTATAVEKAADTLTSVTAGAVTPTLDEGGIPGSINLLTQDDASAAIDICYSALNTVSTQRAELGAIQNRLEHKISNLDNTVENVSAAEARIRDVDIAKEMTNFTKNQILSQAATAMLAQANSLPQNVLSLLQ